MSEIRPFPGYRPRPDAVAEIASPPYDVVDREEALALIKRHARSFMRVIRPEVELDAGLDPKDDQIFSRGKDNLQALIDEGLLVRDDEPCLYLYEQTMGAHVQVGVMAGASVDEYERGLIKRHEKTRTHDLEGRTRHIEALGANTGPVFLTYHARAEINELVDRLRGGEPTYDFVAEDGIRHRLWVVGAADASSLQGACGAVPALYVADGHHRTHASYEVGRRRREAAGADKGEAPYDFYLAVLFPHDQLKLMAYNRVVHDLNGRTPEGLKEELAEKFELEPGAAPEPDRPASFGMYIDGSWYRLSARPGSYPAEDRQGSLDVAILQQNLLQPLLGIENPRSDPRIEFVGGIRGAAELERRADARGGVAFFLYPTAIEQVMAIADAEEVMPPKSTWFEPKLRSGLVVRSIDD